MNVSFRCDSCGATAPGEVECSAPEGHRMEVPTGHDGASLVGPVEVLYTNWKGETRWRLIQPLRVTWRTSQWHPEPQYLLAAIDLETGEEKGFAVAGIAEWRRPAEALA